MEIENNSVQRVSRMDAILFALTLEVVLLQMRIHEGSTELRLACKFVDKKGKEKLKYDKLVREREMIKDVIRRTLTEVAENGAWGTLQKAVGILERRASSAASKRSDHDRLLVTQEKIEIELNTNRNQWAINLRNADQTMAFLRDKMKDDILNASTRLRYAEMWLSARLEAQELRFREQRETKPPPRADHEQRVHDEIKKAFELQIKEREKAAEYWRLRYADDSARMNVHLAEKRQELQVVVAKHAELQKLYDLHEGEMRSWLSFKEQRAARLAREARSRNAATRIQSWWRGLMVRRCLGSFKYLRNVKKSPSKSKKK